MRSGRLGVVSVLPVWSEVIVPGFEYMLTAGLWYISDTSFKDGMCVHMHTSRETRN